MRRHLSRPAYPRREIVPGDEIGVYHCIARCVRKAFLCGVDPTTVLDYEHRKEWIRERLEQLASIFAIDICGYAVMSNPWLQGQRRRPRLSVIRCPIDRAKPIIDDDRATPLGERAQLDATLRGLVSIRRESSQAIDWTGGGIG